MSRRYEEEYYRHYGWPYYWQGDALWGMSGFPILEQATTPLPVEQALVTANYGEEIPASKVDRISYEESAVCVNLTIEAVEQGFAHDLAPVDAGDGPRCGR